MLHALTTTDPLEELGGGRRGRQIQLAAQGFHAGVVLAQGQVVLPFSTVAAHETAMDILPTAVTPQDQVTEPRTRGVVTLAEIDPAEMVEDVEVRDTQLLTGQRRPFFVRSFFQEVSLVEACRGLVLGHRRGDLAGCFQPEACVGMTLEIINVEPQTQVRAEMIRAILEEDELLVGDSSQRLTNTVQGNIQVITSGLWTRGGPKNVHKYVARCGSGMMRQ